MRWLAMLAVTAALAAACALGGCAAQGAVSPAGMAESEPATTNEATATEDDGMGRAYEVEDMWVEHGGKRVYGQLFTPKGLSRPMPAVVCSHYFGGTHRASAEYARAMAEAGYVAYAFDFCGGSAASRSTGDTADCSILTEAADLSAVLDAISALDAVDAGSVFLLGQSQGGAVSAMVAAERPDDVAGLVLLYPAFVIHDSMLGMFGSADAVPDEFDFWQRLGRVYAVDAIGYDFYEHVGAYEGPVLMFQGDRDGIEPRAYTDRAAALYADVDYEVVEGAGHGFYGSDQRHVTERAAGFVASHSAVTR